MRPSLASAAALTCAAATIALTPAPANAYVPVAAQSTATASAECRDLQLINQERTTRGLPALKGLQSDLTYYARKHAQDMASRGTIWHDMPAVQAAAPTGWRGLGENVAYHYQGIDAIHNAYMNSSGHRANILSPSFTHVAIGVWMAGSSMYNSEEFLTHSGSVPLLSCDGTGTDGGGGSGGTSGGSTGGTGGGSAPAPDTSPPTAPPGLRTTSVSNSAVGLAWRAAADNVGVKAYRLYWNGNHFATVGGTTLAYVDRDVYSGDTYTYTVRAVDGAGNIGPTSTGVTVRIPQ